MTALHSEKVGRCFRKASTKGMRFLNFSQASVLASIQNARRIRALNQQFSSEPRSSRLNLGTGWQRQKFIRLLSIRYRFAVLVEGLAAANAYCDDYVYPVTRWSLHVEHISSILDVRNSLVLRQCPMTSVWLGSTHRVNTLMCVRLVGLHDAPNSKVLSHLRFLAISMRNDQGNARPAFISSWCGTEADCEVLSSMLPDGGRLL